MPTAAPTCTKTWFAFDSTLHQCCPNYPAGGIACPSCYKFNYTPMRCDNWFQTPAELPWARVSPTDSFSTGSGGGVTYSSGLYPPCQNVYASDYPCKTGSDVVRNLTQNCIAAYGASAYFTGPCTISGYTVSCAWKRCYDNSLGNVDCFQLNPVWVSSGGSTGFQWQDNPAAIWAWDIVWDRIGCFEQVGCIQKGGNPCGSGAPVWLGCPSGLTSDCTGAGAYGNGNAAFAAATLTRVSYDRTDLTASSCRWVPNMGVFSPVYIQSAKGVQTSAPFGTTIYSIGGNNTTVCACYEPLLTACPTDADNQGGGGAGPCTYNCVTPSCPTGYTFNPTTNLCETPTGRKLGGVRDERTGARYTAQVNSSGQIVVYLDNQIAATSITGMTAVAVDSNTDCKSPSIIALRDGDLVLTYARATGILARRSRDQGKTWSATMTVAPAGFTVHDIKSDRTGMFPVVAAFKTADSKLYIIAGSRNPDDTIAFSAPVSTGLTASEVAPVLHFRSSGVVEMTYIDGGGAMKLVRCAALKQDGTGTWS